MTLYTARTNLLIARFLTVGLFWLWLISATPTAAGAQEPRPLADARVERIRGLIAAAMEQGKIPAVSVSVVSPRGQMSAGFGQMNLATGAVATATTKYRLASLSKPLTAVAVMQLAEQGKVDLDAPVQRYVPPFPVKPWPITVRQVLAHVSGIPHYEGEAGPSNRHFNNVTEALDVFKDDALLFEPGTQFHYSSYGYNLLGCVVEGASGTSFNEYIRQHIFVPAGMTSSGIYDNKARPADLANGYLQRDDGSVVRSEPGDTSYKVPSGGVYSTVGDMSSFAVALASGKLVKPQTRAQMWTWQKLRGGGRTSYGLGWQIMQHAGHVDVAHSGGQAGVTTWLLLRPQEGVVVALFCNLRAPQLGADLLSLVRQIADVASR